MTMKRVEFRGEGDDIFGFAVLGAGDKRIAGDDHDDCAEMTVRAYRIESVSTGTAVIVVGVYGRCPAGTWAIGISPDDEDVAIPVWAEQPRFKTDGYTPVMTLEIPDDSTIKLVRVDGQAPPKNDKD